MKRLISKMSKNSKVGGLVLALSFLSSGITYIATSRRDKKNEKKHVADVTEKLKNEFDKQCEEIKRECKRECNEYIKNVEDIIRQ